MMETYEDIRASVRALAAGFPGEYWRTLDRERGYPTAFVQAMTKAGFLSVLIPEDYGGSGLGIGAAAAILEEVHKQGGNGGAMSAWPTGFNTVDGVTFSTAREIDEDDNTEEAAVSIAASPPVELPELPVSNSPPQATEAKIIVIRAKIISGPIRTNAIEIPSGSIPIQSPEWSDILRTHPSGTGQRTIPVESHGRFAHECRQSPDQAHKPSVGVVNWRSIGSTGDWTARGSRPASVPLCWN